MLERSLDARAELLFRLAAGRRLAAREVRLGFGDRAVVPAPEPALVEERLDFHGHHAEHAAHDRRRLPRAQERAAHHETDAEVHALDLLGEQVRLVAADVHHRQVHVAAAAQPREIGRGDAVAHEIEREGTIRSIGHGPSIL